MGLNAPFRERPGALVQRDGSNLTLSPVFWVSALFLIAAVALYFAPSGLFGLPHWRGQAAASAAASGSPGEAAVASQAAASAGMGDASVTQLAALPGAADSALPAADPAAPTLAPALSPAAPGVIQLHATAPSWIEVTDGNGRSLVARVVQPGETIDLEGPAPFRVRIGNAAGTRVSFRGQPMELAAYTRDNVARLELK